MALETATFLNGLVASNPVSGDAVRQGDDHLRLIKSTLKNTFPNLTGAMNATQAELNHVVGVTSGIQAQLNSKQAEITGAASSIASADLTASRALVSNASGKVDVSPVTLSELEFLDGVTSGVQSQLNSITSRTITAGAGLTGGGDLSANRTISSVQLTQAQAEDPASTVMGQVSGQRLSQAVTANNIGMTLIDEKFPATTPTNNLDFFFDPDAWQALSIEIVNLVPEVDGTELWLRTSADGTTFDAGGSDYATNAYGDAVGGSFFSGGFATQSFITVSPLSFSALSNAWGDGGISGWIKLPTHNFNAYPQAISDVSFIADNGRYTVAKAGGIRRATGRLRGVQLLLSSGNFRAIGAARLYGIPR